jgi:ABC-type nitrate/sulfonate/bicarbonate transport system substrate-binding protein
MTSKNFPPAPSRRHLLGLGLAAGALLGAPALVRAQGRPIKLLQAAPANLPLWSVPFLAEDLGLYKEEGLAVERIKLNNGPAAVTALLAGEGAAVMATPGEMLSATARGQRMVALISYTRTDAYTVLVSKAFADRHKVTAASPLKDREAALKATKGVRIGITAPGSATDLMARAALKQVGLDPARDAQIVPLQSSANAVAAMANNAVDATITLSPFTEQTISEFGAVPLLAVATGELREPARLQGQCLQAKPEVVQANQEAFAAVVRADLRALRMLMEKPDEARDALRRTRFANIKDDIWPTVWRNQLATFSSPFVTRDGMKAWVESGTIQGNPDPAKFNYDSVIDMRFVNEGLKKLNWQVSDRR